MSAVVCKEVFEEGYHPSDADVNEYAIKIGIDPETDKDLLHLAVAGLMNPLPKNWTPCFDKNSESFYYFNDETGLAQWEHPLDNYYRDLVSKAKNPSQSNAEQTDDATCPKSEMPSFEEIGLNAIPSELPPQKILEPIFLNNATKARSFRNAVLKMTSPRQKVDIKESTDTLAMEDEDADVPETFTKHPRLFNEKEVILGNGSMFLKCNTGKKQDSSSGSGSSTPRSILRERPAETFNDNKADGDKNDEKILDDEKKVRFNLERSNSEVTKSRFSVFAVDEPSIGDKDSIPILKIIKPNPTDFLAELGEKSSDSEEDSFWKKLIKKDVNLNNDEDSTFLKMDTQLLEERIEKRISRLKQNIWESKNDELTQFHANITDSHQDERERIVLAERTKHDEIIKVELEKLNKEMETRKLAALAEEKQKFEEEFAKIKKVTADKILAEQAKIKENFESKREELEKYYEEKLVEIEKTLAETMETKRDDLIIAHDSTLEQLKQNHQIILEEIKKDFQNEEQELRTNHHATMLELKQKQNSEQKNRSKTEMITDEKFEKIRCEKRLVEDKYKCLKEKYIKLKSDIKREIEKRHKKKEERSCTTTNTGSETERSTSNNKEKVYSTISKKNLDKPPVTPKSSRNGSDAKIKPELSKKYSYDLDTSASERSPQSEEKYKGRIDESSDNSVLATNGRSRKKLLTRIKSTSATRSKSPKRSTSKTGQRPCSPVENLRRQLQKLEDLEDQFPETQQIDTTYHLRYPFPEDVVRKFEGSSELEFFRHRIHLERDSIKRARESLRGQKVAFQQRKKELSLKHGSMARHTYQQLCQEEKEITDMEVSLHRTRSLLGEKVIRLRHLEQSLQRATEKNENPGEDATLSDISSHSASSGISSSEFHTADYKTKGVVKGENFQESSEIIQSLENLNYEIREIWEVLRKQQLQSGNVTGVIPPFVYPDLGWPLLQSGPLQVASAPPSIPTLADRLNNYRQQIALAGAQSTVVTHAANQGATTTLVERTRNLRHWLRQAGIDNGMEGGPTSTQATL